MTAMPPPADPPRAWAHAGPTAIPTAARVLGFSGLLPNLLVLGLLLAVQHRPEAAMLRYAAAMSAQIYAAVILSFLGGTWWGIAAVRVPPERLWGWLAVAVVPSLIAAAAFASSPLARPPLGIAVVLGAGLMLALFGDRQLLRAGLAPGWWLRLRVPLSVGLALETVAVALLV